MVIHGRSIFPGKVTGNALVSKMDVAFFGGIDPESGIMTEKNHDLYGQTITGQILVFPAGKGSTVGSYTLYRLKESQLAPLAIVNIECEPITAVGCIIAEIPCVDQIDITLIETGSLLFIDGANGIVQILEKPKKK